MKKHEFELRVCRAHKDTVYTKGLMLTLQEAKELFFNLIMNDPTIVMCEIYWRRYGNIYNLFTYNNHNSLATNKKQFDDEQDEPPCPEPSTQEEYEETCRMWLNSEGQLFQDMGD